MTQKNKLLAVAGLPVALALCAYLSADWFRLAEMEIYDRISTGRPIRKAARTNETATATSVVFGFDRYYALTDVKVVAVAELATNKHARPLWHLVSDSNSIPIKGF